MSQTKDNSTTEAFSRKQQLFLRYLTWTLVDLTVLNFFAEYWDKVTITSFGVSLFIAITLQVLLKTTISLEHRISKYMKSKERLDKKYCISLPPGCIVRFQICHALGTATSLWRCHCLCRCVPWCCYFYYFSCGDFTC